MHSSKRKKNKLMTICKQNQKNTILWNLKSNHSKLCLLTLSNKLNNLFLQTMLKIWILLLFKPTKLYQLRTLKKEVASIKSFLLGNSIPKKSNFLKDTFLNAVTVFNTKELHLCRLMSWRTRLHVLTTKKNKFLNNQLKILILTKVNLAMVS